MSDDEAYLDQLHWFDPKSQAVKHKVKDWIKRVKLQSKEAEQCDAEVECTDNLNGYFFFTTSPLSEKIW